MKREDLTAYVDGELSASEVADLEAELQGRPDLAQEVAKLCRQRFMIQAHFASKTAVTIPQRPVEIRPARWWFIPLAAAASLAIAVGVWWFSQRQAAGLGLRVAEIQRSEVGGQRSEVRVQRSGGKNVAAVVGMELRQGDRVVVKDGGKVGLQYDREATTIDLHGATATFRAENGAKRVNLAAGTLVCTAVPQKVTFQIETPHAMAEVVGTRFWLAVAQAETALAVREGKVALRQKDKSLEVKAGETAVADGAGMRRLSPEDAWIRELLVRAEGGSWDALDLKRGYVLGGSGVWCADLRGEPAGRRVWHTNPDGQSMVFLDEARWKRGVLVGRVMMLPSGTLPSALAIPEQASNAGWKTDDKEITGVDGKADPPPKGVFLTLYKNSDYVSVLGSLDADTQPRGVWHRFAVYFDMDAKGGAFVAWKTWPADLTGPPPAAQWSSGRKTYAHLTGNTIGLGLCVNDVPVLWQGLKLMPLGTDMPPPPPRAGVGREKVSREQGRPPVATR